MKGLVLVYTHESSSDVGYSFIMSIEKQRRAAALQRGRDLRDFHIPRLSTSRNSAVQYDIRWMR